MPMDLGEVGQLPKEGGAPEPAAATAGDEPPAALNAVADRTCYKRNANEHRATDCTSRPDVNLACNKRKGWGHYAAKCPSKGEKGKGKDKGGDAKGKGKNWGQGGKGYGKDFGERKGNRIDQRQG